MLPGSRKQSAAKCTSRIQETLQAINSAYLVVWGVYDIGQNLPIDRVIMIPGSRMYTLVIPASWIQEAL